MIFAASFLLLVTGTNAFTFVAALIQCRGAFP